MPTEKPRISITLEPADLAVLDRFAAAAGQPRASFISAMISAAVPEFARAAEVMELAKDAPAGVVRSVVEGLSNATTDSMGMLAGSVDEYALLLKRTRGEGARERSEARRAEGPRLRGGTATRPGAKRPPRPQDPHLLTGGSK